MIFSVRTDREQHPARIKQTRAAQNQPDRVQEKCTADFINLWVIGLKQNVKN